MRAAWCLRELIPKFPLYSAGEMLVLKGKRRESSRGKTKKKFNDVKTVKAGAVIGKHLWSRETRRKGDGWSLKSTV